MCSSSFRFGRTSMVATEELTSTARSRLRPQRRSDVMATRSRGPPVCHGINRLAPHWPRIGPAAYRTTTQEDGLRGEANSQVDGHLIASPQVAESSREPSQGGDTGFEPRRDSRLHPATGLLVGSPCSTARMIRGGATVPTQSPLRLPRLHVFSPLDEIGLASASGTRRVSMGSEWGLGRLRIGSTTADVSAIHWFAASRLRRRGQSRHPAVGSG